MNYIKFIIMAVLFAAVAGLFSWLLLNSPVEVQIDCHSKQPADLKIYPSLPMEREIGEKAYVCHLNASEDKAGRLQTEFPLSCLRKLRIEFPPETGMELSRMEYKMFGFIRCRVSMYFLAKSSSEGLKMTQLYGDSGQAERVRIQTRQQSGRLDIRVVNDLPRFMAFLIGMLAAAVILFAVCQFAAACRTGRNTEKLLTVSFLILIYAGMIFTVILPSGPSASGRPELNLLRLPDYPRKYASWYQRNLPLRDQLIFLYHKFCSLMKSSSTDTVIQGQNDWLFLCYNRNENAYESYLGTNLFTESELQRILERLKKAQIRLKKANIRFAIFISPGKLSIYNDQLQPELRRKDPGGMTRAIQFCNYIRKNSDIPIEFPLQEMISARKSIPQPVYYKADTHWNYLGGYVGARAMMKLIDPEVAAGMPELAALDRMRQPRASGDLFRMLNVEPSDKHDSWVIPDPGIHYQYSSLTGSGGCYSLSGQNRTGKRVFFIRDSYFCAMAPFLARHLSHFTCYWDFSLNMSMIEQEQPDIVVMEILERSLGSLLNFGEVSWHLMHGERML